MANDFMVYLFEASLALPYVAVAVALALLAISKRAPAADNLTSRRAA